MLCYCEKCGRLVQKYKENNDLCDYCHNVVLPVPDEYLGGRSKCFIKNELKEQFVEKYIKSSPKFDQYLFEHRYEDLSNRRIQDAAKMEHGRAVLEGKSKRLTCPYCNSTRVSRIGLLSRIVSVEFWGLASSKIGKQWHCDNCGSEF